MISMNMAYWIQKRWNQSNEDLPNYDQIRDAIQALKRIHAQVQGQGKQETLQRIKLLFTISKSYLQLAASFSKFLKHAQALSAVKSALEHLGSLLANSQTILSHRGESANTPSKPDTANAQSESEAKALHQQFASFTEFAQLVFESVSSICKSFDSANGELSFNEKADQLASLVPREIPKKLDVFWMGDVSIANFMHLEYTNFDVLNWDIQYNEFFSQTFLTFVVMLSSVVLFALSTENRFVLFDSFNTPRNNSFRIKSIFEKTHQQRVRKMKRFVFSDKVHSKAICLLDFFLCDNQLSAHLLNSYRKNYHSVKNLEEIVSLKAGSRGLSPELVSAENEWHGQRD